MINDTPNKFLPQFIVQAKYLFKITTSFDKKFEQISLNIRVEDTKSKPETTFEKNIDEIKADHKKMITSLDMNILSIN